jgi:hypothetical protein
MDNRLDGSSDPVSVGHALWTERPQVISDSRKPLNLLKTKDLFFMLS